MCSAVLEPCHCRKGKKRMLGNAELCHWWVNREGMECKGGAPGAAALNCRSQKGVSQFARKKPFFLGSFRRIEPAQMGFWDPKWVKNGSKTRLSKNDPGPLGMHNWVN